MNYLKRKMKSGFIINTFKLVFATALGQLIFILISPILTRLYSPGEFGEMAIFVSFISILSVGISLRYELAIPIPNTDDKAIRLLVLSILLIVVNVIIILVILTIYYFSNFYFFEINKGISFLIPISVLGIGLYKVLNYWYIRKNDFSIIATSKITQSISQSIIQLIFGIISLTKVGLIIGDSIGRITGTSRFTREFLRGGYLKLEHFDRKKIIKVAKEFKEFPIYSTPGSLLNTASTQMAPIGFFVLFGNSMAGLFSLVYRVISGPVMMIGLAVSQVYLQELSSITRSLESQKKVKQLYYSVSKRLFTIAIVPTLIIYFFSDLIFGIIFGPSWSQAGQFASILIIMIFFQFIVSPISQTLIILKKQRLQAIWEISRFALILLVFLVSYKFSMGEVTTLILFTIAMSVMYLIMFLICGLVLKYKANIRGDLKL